jgi:hypothetical protein
VQKQDAALNLETRLKAEDKGYQWLSEALR